jgi:hypothetical protein
MRFGVGAAGFFARSFGVPVEAALDVGHAIEGGDFVVKNFSTGEDVRKLFCASNTERMVRIGDLRGLALALRVLVGLRTGRAFLALGGGLGIGRFGVILIFGQEAGWEGTGEGSSENRALHDWEVSDKVESALIHVATSTVA